jgi:hypothetical protein
MPVTTLNLRLQPYRLMTRTEAAHYCRRPAKNFEAHCPVAPIVMPNGDRLWDVRDLDTWIDSLKANGADEAEQALARLE